ncbi:MAG: helix-turn-helix domain-containing protein [Syntrophales bacterium]|nr:helix-turn-helix domain-containing protein [Syntrophales bacterium]
MDKRDHASSLPLEDIIGEELEDIVTLLCSTGTEKSRLYEDILSMVERGLIKIALKRSSNVKITTADFLGMNRNTLHKKIDKLGIDCRKIRK